MKERAPDLRRSRPTARRATRSATRRDRLSASALALPDRSPRRRRPRLVTRHRTSRLTAVSSSRKRRFEVAATKASRIPASFLTSPAATATNSDTMRPPARGGCGGRGFGGRSDGGDRRGAGASAGEAMAVAAAAGVAGEAGRPGAVVVAAGEGEGPA